MDPIRDILQFHRPLDDETFKREAKRLSTAAQSERWLYMETEESKREPWQGDVCPGLRLAFVAEDGQIEEYVGTVMLLSTTCDAVPGQDPYAVFAPVFAVAEFLEGLTAAQQTSKLNALKGGHYARYLYLPAANGYPDSYVDFSQAASVSTRYAERIFEDAPLGARLRLSRLGWYFFNYKLGYYYARAEDEGEIPRRTTIQNTWAVVDGADH
ncbi:MAG TPA: hypothetical protein VGC13_24835 [Longimicrobium sp.]|jgi:hypothetical protein|uniref:hypothetical protein n=1 Tax=Longimicrobium sp. TaxID=2029185 RepID=UPI002ED7E365